MLATPPSGPVAVGSGGLIPVGFGWPLEKRLQGWNSVGLNRGVRATLDRESEGTIDRRQLIRPQSLGLPFPEAYPGNAYPSFHFVVERHGVAPEMQPARQRLQLLPGLVVHQIPWVERDPAAKKVFPARHIFQLLPYSEPDLLGRYGAQHAPGAAPELIQLRQAAPQTLLIGMNRFALD